MSQGPSLIQATPTQVQQDQKEAVPLHVPISAVRPATSSSLKANLSSPCHTWHGQTEKGTSGCAVAPQDRIPSPVSPLASMTLAAAFVTAVLTMSLPTAFMRRELRARFCLLVPKASMHKSICTGHKHALKTHPVRPAEHKTHCCVF